MAPLASSKSILKRSPSEVSSGSNSLDNMRKVWFDSVEIKYHKIILGDNPAVSDGAPVTIGWEAHDAEVIDVECYEVLRKTDSKKRHGVVNKIPVQTRAAMLLDCGYSIKNLASTIEEVDKIKDMRAESATNTKWERFSAVFESTGKSFRKLAGKTSKPSDGAIRNPAA